MFWLRTLQQWQMRSWGLDAAGHLEAVLAVVLGWCALSPCSLLHAPCLAMQEFVTDEAASFKEHVLPILKKPQVTGSCCWHSCTHDGLVLLA